MGLMFLFVFVFSVYIPTVITVIECWVSNLCFSSLTHGVKEKIFWYPCSCYPIRTEKLTKEAVLSALHCADSRILLFAAGSGDER